MPRRHQRRQAGGLPCRLQDAERRHEEQRGTFLTQKKELTSGAKADGPSPSVASLLVVGADGGDAVLGPGLEGLAPAEADEVGRAVRVVRATEADGAHHHLVHDRLLCSLLAVVIHWGGG